MSIPMRIPEGKIMLTYDDYAALPNDGKRYEILEGELAVTPAPSTKHQTASVNLTVLLTQHIREKDLGKLFHAPLDLILESGAVLQPDLLFVRKLAGTSSPTVPSKARRIWWLKFRRRQPAGATE